MNPVADGLASRTVMRVATVFSRSPPPSAEIPRAVTVSHLPSAGWASASPRCPDGRKGA